MILRLANVVDYIFSVFVSRVRRQLIGGNFRDTVFDNMVQRTYVTCYYQSI